jgi:hypothetical protein
MRYVANSLKGHKPTCGIARSFAAPIAEDFRSSACLLPAFAPAASITGNRKEGQPRARGELPRLDGLSNRRVDLCGERGPSIKFDREGSHRDGTARITNLGTVL